MKTVLLVAGPTASGKTAFSVHLALQLGAEIVSADSRQFYHELSIGTARPSEEEMQGIPHHFIGSHSIFNPLSAGQYEVQALQCLQQLFLKTDLVVLTGGSGLFIKALIEGLNDIPPVSTETKIKVQQLFAASGLEGLQARLLAADPAHYHNVDRHNPLRLMRALEICFETGLPYSSFLNAPLPARPFRVLKAGLAWPRADLYNRINQRVDSMLSAGLEAEATQFIEHQHINALQTVGYSEFFRYFNGELNYAETVELIKRNTRRYAKRQLTWFNADTEITWLHPQDKKGLVELLNRNGL